MPHEKINYPTGNSGTCPVPVQAVVGWNEIGWVQVSIYPDGWSSTGDASHVALSEPEVSKLIKTLKRAKRQAYGGGSRHAGFEDRKPMPDGSDLFTS